MRRLAPLLLLPLMLTACNRPAAPTGASPTEAPVAASSSAKLPDVQDLQALLQIAFPRSYRAASKDAIAELPVPGQRGAKHHYLMTALAAQRLENGMVALVVNGSPSNERGEDMASHADGGTLNVYLLEAVNGELLVRRRHESVASLGSQGQIGEVVWTTLAPGKPGLAMIDGGTWQGYTIGTLTLYDLLADSLRDLTGGGIRLSSNNEGGCGPQTPACWSVEGKWSVAAASAGKPYGDLLIDFSGYRDQIAEDVPAPAPGSEASEGTLRERVELLSGTRYTYANGKYTLIKGENIVPAI